MSMQAEDDFVRPLRDLVEQQVRPLVDWYQRKKRWPRRLHKTSTAGVIVLGALIPIVSVSSGSTVSRVFVGALGASITMVTGLSAAYDWYRRWRIFTIAQSALESHLATWELAIARARLLSREAGQSEALAATSQLIDAVNKARSEETEAFFEAQGDKAALTPFKLDGSGG